MSRGPSRQLGLHALESEGVTVDWVLKTERMLNGFSTVRNCDMLQDAQGFLPAGILGIHSFPLTLADGVLHVSFSTVLRSSPNPRVLGTNRRPCLSA